MLRLSSFLMMGAKLSPNCSTDLSWNTNGVFDDDFPRLSYWECCIYLMLFFANGFFW